MLQKKPGKQSTLPKQRFRAESLLVVLLFFTSLAYSPYFLNTIWPPKFYAFFFTSVILLLVFISRYLFLTSSVKINLTLPSVFFLCYVLYTIVQLWVNGNLVLTNHKFVELVIYTALFFTIKQVLNQYTSLKTWRIILLGYLSIALVQSFCSIAQMTGLIPNLMDLYSFGGTFGNPNILATYLITILPFSLTIYWFYKGNEKTDRFIKQLSLVVAVMGLFLVIISKSRSAWLGFSGGLLLVLQYRFNLLAYIKKLTRTALAKVAVLIVALGVIYIAGYALFHFKQESANGRSFIWKNTCKIIREKPIFGIGYGNFPVVYNNFQSTYFKNNPDDNNIKNAACIDTAFNELLEIVAESGIIGLIGFVGFIIFLLLRKAPESETEKIFFLAALSSFIALLINSIFSYTIYILPVYFNFIFLAALLSNLSVGKTIFKTTISGKAAARIAFIIIIIIFYVSFNIFNEYKSEKDLFKSTELLRNRQPIQAELNCSKAYPYLAQNNEFILYYAHIMMINNHYDKVIELLEKSKAYCHKDKLYMLLGDSYLAKENYQKSEENYLHAFYQVPNLCLPMASLVQLYEKQGQMHKALFWANKIVYFKEKVPSTKVSRLKERMTKFIEEHKN